MDEKGRESPHHIYEDIEARGPPRLAPSSGVLHHNKDKMIIRPVAFKPVIPHRLATPTSLLVPCGSSTHTSPYSSSESNTPGHYNCSYIMEDDHRSCTYSVDSCVKLSDSSYSSQLHCGNSSFNLEEFVETPSPSDSGIAELEAMLREKDSEINYLRETLEQNEQVIFKVYEEKEQCWHREIKKLRLQYETKLRAIQQKLAKTEHLLSVQSFQLTQDKNKLQDELEEIHKAKLASDTQAEQIQKELKELRSHLEETEWSLCQKTGEMSLLKSQLKDSQGDNSFRTTEMLTLKAQLKESRQVIKDNECVISDLKETAVQLQHELDYSKPHLERAIQNLQVQQHELILDNEEKDLLICKQKKELEILGSELQNLRREMESSTEGIEEERIQWLEEKEKVIRYQKQLQLNYINMYRRNKCLESEVEHLALELNKDSKTHCDESHC